MDYRNRTGSNRIHAYPRSIFNMPPPCYLYSRPHPPKYMATAGHGSDPPTRYPKVAEGIIPVTTNFLFPTKTHSNCQKVFV